MVHLFYYEHVGQSCKALWQVSGRKLKVFLYVDDSWADAWGQGYIVLSRSRWTHSNKVKILEVSGTNRWRGQGRIVPKCNKSILQITGSINKGSSTKKKTYLRLTLTTDVTTTDFHMGYCMSGCLERSVKKCSDFSQTHLAFVKRVSDLDQFRSTNLVPIQHHSSTTPLWHHVRQSMSLFRSGLRQCLAKSRGYFRLNTSS